MSSAEQAEGGVRCELTRGESATRHMTLGRQLAGGYLFVGSDHSAHWVIGGRGVQPLHVALTWHNGTVWVADYAGAGDVHLDGRPVSSWTPIEGAGSLQLAGAELRLTPLGAARPASAAPAKTDAGSAASGPLVSPAATVVYDQPDGQGAPPMATVIHDEGARGEGSAPAAVPTPSAAPPAGGGGGPQVAASAPAAPAGGGGGPQVAASAPQGGAGGARARPKQGKGPGRTILWVLASILAFVSVGVIVMRAWIDRARSDAGAAAEAASDPSEPTESKAQHSAGARAFMEDELRVEAREPLSGELAELEAKAAANAATGHYEEALPLYRELSDRMPDHPVFEAAHELIRNRIEGECHDGIGPDGEPCDTY